MVATAGSHFSVVSAHRSWYRAASLSLYLLYMYVLCIHPARDQSDQCNAIINELRTIVHVVRVHVPVLKYVYVA